MDGCDGEQRLLRLTAKREVFDGGLLAVFSDVTEPRNRREGRAREDARDLSFEPLYEGVATLIFTIYQYCYEYLLPEPVSCYPCARARLNRTCID